MSLTKRIEAALEGITPGEWKRVGMSVIAVPKVIIKEIHTTTYDANLIAQAPSLLGEALVKIKEFEDVSECQVDHKYAHELEGLHKEALVRIKELETENAALLTCFSDYEDVTSELEA